MLKQPNQQHKVFICSRHQCFSQYIDTKLWKSVKKRKLLTLRCLYCWVCIHIYDVRPFTQTDGVAGGFVVATDYDNLWGWLGDEAACKINSSLAQIRSGGPFLGIQIEVPGLPGYRMIWNWFICTLNTQFILQVAPHSVSYIQVKFD